MREAREGGDSGVPRRPIQKKAGARQREQGCGQRARRQQGLPLALVCHAATLAFDDDGVGRMPQPIQDGRGQGAVRVKEGGPLLQSAVGGKDQRPLFLAQADHLAEPIGTGLVHGESAELVEDEERRFGLFFPFRFEPTRPRRRGQRVQDSNSTSKEHREGPDLDLIVEWAAGARTALDVATGGGHVARRLREAGLDVVSCDAAPGMRPDVVCRAEDLPFADESFDVVISRLGAHHFEDVEAAVREMARVARERVLVVDNVYSGEAAEEADHVRDPSHVRKYSEDEWRGLFAGAGLRITDVRQLERAIRVTPWLEGTGCAGADAERVRELLADRIDADTIRIERIALSGSKR